LTDLRPAFDELSQGVVQEAEPVDRYALALERLTKKTMKILRFLCESGGPRTVLTANISQPELAKKLHVTRQALSVHISRLSEAGFIQVGRGFINITETGMKASGYHHSPVILIVRVAPQNHRDAYDKIKRIHASEIFRVAGDADFALLLEHRDLDKVLQDLYSIPGVLETKSLIATETVRQATQ
jgi:DNA-binding Lrp family transcriptional regulator